MFLSTASPRSIGAMAVHLMQRQKTNSQCHTLLLDAFAALRDPKKKKALGLQSVKRKINMIFLHKIVL